MIVREFDEIAICQGSPVNAFYTVVLCGQYLNKFIPVKYLQIRPVIIHNLAYIKDPFVGENFCIIPGTRMRLRPLISRRGLLQLPVRRIDEIMSLWLARNTVAFVQAR